MAVRAVSAKELPDLSAAKPVRTDARVMHGSLRVATGTVDLLDDDSAGSKFEMVRIPSRARIHRGSKVIAGAAFTGQTNVDLGIAASVDCLRDGMSIASAGERDGASQIAVGDLTKPAWELAGLSADPGGMLSVYLTLNQANTVAGTVAVDLLYVTD